MRLPFLLLALATPIAAVSAPSMLGCAHLSDADSAADTPMTTGSTSGGSSSGAPNVLVSRSSPAASCVRVGEVTGSAFSAFRDLGDAFKVAGEEMQQNAAALGGDYVEEETVAGNGRELFRQGIAYRCSGTATTGESWNDEKTSPGGAAGFLFGDSASMSEDRCRARGFAWSAGIGYGQCSSAPVDTGIGGGVAVRFCGDRLCAVVLATTPQVHSSKAWIEAFARLRTVLEAKYGKAFRNDTHVPVECRDDVLPCLDDARASVEVTWSWHGGRRIALRMGKLEDKSGDDAIRLRYDEPQGNAPNASGL